MNLGKRVKLARMKRRITQAQLADRIGASQAAISALEGRDSKTSEHLFALARELSVPAEWLMTGEGSPGFDDSDGDLPEDAIEVGRKWLALSPEKRRAITGLLDSLGDAPRASSPAGKQAVKRGLKKAG